MTTNAMYSLVTGASSGIGRACVEMLAELGRSVIVVARRLDQLELLRQEIEAKHKVEILPFQLDVSHPEQIDAFYASIADKKIDVLINNAGLARGRASLESYDWKDIEEMVDVNIKGFVRVAQGAIPFLKETQGHIVNISSVAGIEAYEGSAVYCGTKAFVKMISKGLRIDLAGTGIRVTDIAPGAVNTEFSTVRFHGDQTKADQVYEGFVPLYAEDIAECIRFSLTRPPSVTIEYMLVMPTAQASITRIHRDNQRFNETAAR